MSKEGNHISQGLDHGGREPDREFLMIWNLGHLGLGLQYDEDGIEKLTPENIPESRWEVAAISNKRFKEICESPTKLLATNTYYKKARNITSIELPSHLQS